MNIPRCEFPDPMKERENYEILNGEWDFDFDFSKSGIEREIYKGGKLSKKITVPFCPESVLSGIHFTDFIPCVWYRRTINVKKVYDDQRVILHFGAVDYETHVYIGGREVGTHIGGYTSFEFDITDFVTVGENELYVCAIDDTRSKCQPIGKQSDRCASYGCSYTRTTGIWQTVYIEYLPDVHIEKFRFLPNTEKPSLVVNAELCGHDTLTAEVTFEGKKVGYTEISAQGNISFEIELSEKHLWQVGKGGLYDIVFTFGKDRIKSYFGLRSVGFDGYDFTLNGKPTFLCQVLDQGFYPDGIYTARDEEAIINDIRLSQNVGFNGARLHQKVFEPRFLYHCDRLGYLVFGEYPNWFIDYHDPVATGNIICEWTESLERDFNHPSIIGWCPTNETWGYIERKEKTRLVEALYRITRLLDPTRPCIDASGNYHCDIAQIYDVHDYEQDPAIFAENYAHIAEGRVDDQIGKKDSSTQPYRKGMPVFLSEYGGIGWTDGKDGAWGHGNNPKTEEEYFARFEGLFKAVCNNPYIFGVCYTQLYDVEQECNGIYHYDRTPKFDIEKFRKILTNVKR